MKAIYIAGCYRANSEWELELNIRKAEDAAIKLWEAGWAVICPHKNSAHFGGALDIPDSVWLEGGLELLSRCDAIYMLDNWGGSIGAWEELNKAKELGLGIYYGDTIPSP